MKTIPKGIKNHPGVLEADLDNDCESGYRADVILKEDWHFAGLDDNAPRGSRECRRMGFFLTLKEFKEARPEQYK